MVLSRHFHADFKVEGDLDDNMTEEFFEEVVEGKAYPKDCEFELKHCLKSSRLEWKIVDLNSYDKIKEEGNHQKNCLQTFSRYVQACYWGSCSLFSLRKGNDRITTEVDRQGQVIQFMGHHNESVNWRNFNLKIKENPKFEKPKMGIAEMVKADTYLRNILAMVRNRNEFLDFISELRSMDIYKVEDIISACSQEIYDFGFKAHKECE